MLGTTEALPRILKNIAMLLCRDQPVFLKPFKQINFQMESFLKPN